MCCNVLKPSVSIMYAIESRAACVMGLSACAQEAVDNLLAQVSQLAAPRSRLCFDALHRDHMDGRVKMRGYTNGARVRPCQRPSNCRTVAVLSMCHGIYFLGACHAPMCMLYSRAPQCLVRTQRAAAPRMAVWAPSSL